MVGDHFYATISCSFHPPNLIFLYSQKNSYTCTDMSDEEIESVSIPRGIPLIYKFDDNMQLIQPKKSKLTLSSGVFLEKPDLFEKALEKQIGWDQSVPGQLHFSNKERAMTVEKALESLRQEKEMYTSNSTDYHLEGTHQMSDTDENFEETHNIDTSSTSTRQPTLNINKVDPSQDGIVVLGKNTKMVPSLYLILYTNFLKCNLQLIRHHSLSLNVQSDTEELPTIRFVIL